ncbi:MAG: ABC transporter substrate-binding protein [Cardiobacteriaceae bacterium]|nr:ABC transporter substrate-binding protein [Cardiobacteriaceae bacterium]
MRGLMKAASVMMALALAQQGVAKELVDIAGRTVTIPDQVERVALGEGRMIYGIALLQDNPVARIVGWRSDLAKNDPDTLEKIAEKFPEALQITDLGDPYATDVNLEALLKGNPQVYILNVADLLKAEETGLIAKLEKAGVAPVFIDFRQFPLQNTVPSMEVLGKVFGAEARAAKFNDYYRKQMAVVQNRVAGLKEDEKPLVFVDRAAGYDPSKCCSTFGPQNYGELVARAGGINWGSGKFGGLGGSVNPEVIFSEPFDVVIATGANWKKAKPDVESVNLGYAANKDTAHKELEGLAARKGWADISAVKTKRFHAIYHQFYNSPYHFAALQEIAKWLHPERFADLDPEQTLIDFHKEFLPFDYSGTFWISL